jgi:sulfatase maturation enzyme AslB (radical SAM superfamily)
MCGGFASSSLASEYEIHKEKFVTELGMLMPHEKTVRWWDDPNNLNNLKNVLAHASIVKFAGGEPLMVPEVVDILNSLNTNTVKWIKFNTNLTRLTDKFLTALERFENVELTVSLEGYGAHNEYIRYDSDWSVIENNINRAREHSNISIYINHVLQHTSLFSLPNLIKFADDKNIKINIHEIYYGTLPSPGVLTIHSAHAKDIEKFKSWLDSYNGRYKTILTTWVNTYNYSQEFHDKFYKYINLLDSIRGCNFKETFNPTTE